MRRGFSLSGFGNRVSLAIATGWIATLPGQWWAAGIVVGVIVYLIATVAGHASTLVSYAAAMAAQEPEPEADPTWER